MSGSAAGLRLEVTVTKGLTKARVRAHDFNAQRRTLRRQQLPANSSPRLVSVFDLEDSRLKTGHLRGAFSDAKSRKFFAQNAAFKKTANFRGNRACAAVWAASFGAQNQSARFVRMPESQMKGKASATSSPFDRGLLLGRGRLSFLNF